MGDALEPVRDRAFDMRAMIEFGWKLFDFDWDSHISTISGG